MLTKCVEAILSEMRRNSIDRPKTVDCLRKLNAELEWNPQIPLEVFAQMNNKERQRVLRAFLLSVAEWLEQTGNAPTASPKPDP